MMDPIPELENQLLKTVLFHETLNRNDLARLTGLCPASITNHTRALLEGGLLLATPHRKAAVKRPVEDLTINPAVGTHLAIRLAGREMCAELLDFSGSPVGRAARTLPELTQYCFFRALAQLFDELTERASQEKRTFLSAGIGIDGLVAPQPGVIFGIYGFSEWEPCDLTGILPQLRTIPEVRVWTRILCKTRGFAAARKCNHAIGYIEYTPGCFRFGTIQQGRPDLGYHGTASNALHRTVVSGSGLCYCGRQGCLAEALRHGSVPVESLAEALRDTLREGKVRLAGIEWHDSTLPLKQVEETKGAEVQFHPVSGDGDEFFRRGLRGLVVESAIDRMTRKVSS